MTKAVARHVSNRRLLKLADFLESQVEDEKFDLQTWAELEKDLKHGCGTTACAVGWACSIPSFRKAGLKLEYNHKVWGKDHVIMFPKFRDSDSYAAVAEFFGIAGQDAMHLFCPDSYRRGHQTRLDVIERIRDFMKNREGK